LNQFKYKKMKKRTLRIGLGIVLFGLLTASIVVIYMFNKPHMDIASEKAEFSLSAAQLYQEFKTDENTANKKYLSGANGKVIQISGIVSEKITGDKGELTLSLKEQAMAEGAISCSMDSTNIAKANTFKVGDKIILKGQCTGYIELTSEVSMNKCVVIE
jgi:hypothetical protein